jgi:dTDP-4-dehydrorhamnose 3,5-epimerase
MRFTPTKLDGAYLVELETHSDERGFLARAWCAREFEAHGIDHRIAQINVSYNVKRGTLRGMHYQLAPHAEAKVVRCTHGAIFDVIADLRVESATYLEWFAVVLDASNRNMLFVPEGFAHGFQTLADETEVLYLMSEFYQPDVYWGFPHDDPSVGIDWPLPVTLISEQDRRWPAIEPVGRH